MKRIYNYLKKDAVLTISFVLAIISMLFIKPDKAYAGYIDWAFTWDIVESDDNNKRLYAERNF